LTLIRLAGVSNTVVQGAALGSTALQSESDPIWSAVSNTVTAGAALGSTALQTVPLQDYNIITNPPWLTSETDPVWSAVSNTVTTGAALGATAIQSETDPTASAARLRGLPGREERRKNEQGIFRGQRLRIQRRPGQRADRGCAGDHGAGSAAGHSQFRLRLALQP
jgi:hypothetical protein